MLEDLSVVIGGEEQERMSRPGELRGGGREDLSGHGRAVKIAQRPLCNKGQEFKPIFCLVANSFSALALITKNPAVSL